MTGRPYAPPVVQEPLFDRAMHFLADRVIDPALFILVTSPTLMETLAARVVTSEERGRSWRSAPSTPASPPNCRPSST